MSDKQAGRRLDLLVVERGLAETRARAQSLIMDGGILVNGAVATKPSMMVSEESDVQQAAASLRYVSRGALKLRHAIDSFGIAMAGKVVLDIGASTGGFTDVLLEDDAARVYAIDVGYGQFAWRLRNDPRVVVMERTNIRYLDVLPEPADAATVDVSFISLCTVLPSIGRLLTTTSEIIALVKPQFEAGRRQVGRKGVVRDPNVWRTVLESVTSCAVHEGWTVGGLERSPITGPAGNVEFLLLLSRGSDIRGVHLTKAIDRVIDADERFPRNYAGPSVE